MEPLNESGTAFLFISLSVLKMSFMIAVVGEDATAHDIRQRYSCPKCKTKGNNTYQIIYRGNSDVALDGAAVGPE